MHTHLNTPKLNIYTCRAATLMPKPQIWSPVAAQSIELYPQPYQTAQPALIEPPLPLDSQMDLCSMIELVSCS